MPIMLKKKTVRSTVSVRREDSATVADPTELLSVEQAAAFLGVAQITIRRWLKAGIIPSFRAGKQIRIDRAELLKFLQNQ